MDTSATFVRPGVSQGSSGSCAIEVIGEKATSNLFIVNAHLQAGRPNHVARLVQHVIQDPEQWFTSCMRLVNYMLKHPKALLTHKVDKEVWLNLYSMAASNERFRFYEESLGFCILRLGLKYMTLGMMDEALYLAFKSKIPQLLTAIKAYANKKGNVTVENLISLHEEKTTDTPGTNSSVLKAMVQIANFSGKQLRKEDYNNLYKDFETLIKIEDITDLELQDFNGWEIDLDQYQRALDLEFEGNFAEAEKLYAKNDIKNDVLRA